MIIDITVLLDLIRSHPGTEDGSPNLYISFPSPRERKVDSLRNAPEYATTDCSQIIIDIDSHGEAFGIEIF